jgi:hypothetical protein
LAGDDDEKLISAARLKDDFAGLSLARSPVRGNPRLLRRRKSRKHLVRNRAGQRRCGWLFITHRSGLTNQFRMFVLLKPDTLADDLG